MWQSHLGLAFSKLACLDVSDYMGTITLFLDLKHTACNSKTSFLNMKLFTPMAGTLVPGCGTIYARWEIAEPKWAKIEKWNAKEAAASKQVAYSSSTC